MVACSSSVRRPPEGGASCLPQGPKPTLRLQVEIAAVACAKGSRPDEAETCSSLRHIPTGPRIIKGHHAPGRVGRVKIRRPPLRPFWPKHLSQVAAASLLLLQRCCCCHVHDSQLWSKHNSCYCGTSTCASRSLGQCPLSTGLMGNPVW